MSEIPSNIPVFQDHQNPGPSINMIAVEGKKCETQCQFSSVVLKLKSCGVILSRPAGEPLVYHVFKTAVKNKTSKAFVHTHVCLTAD